VNVGNPTEFTMSQLAAEIAQVVGVQITTRICPLPVDDPRQRKPDISRARDMLDWSPKVSLRDGLKRTVEYFEKRVLPNR